MTERCRWFPNGNNSTVQLMAIVSRLIQFARYPFLRFGVSERVIMSVCLYNTGWTEITGKDENCVNLQRM